MHYKPLAPGKLIQPLQFKKLTIPTVPRPRLLIRPQRRRVVVQGKSQPYWKEREWELRGMRLCGFYRTLYGSWEGRIENSPSKIPEFYINNPPYQLREHPKWMCFHQEGLSGWYRVNFMGTKRDVSSGLLEIENMIAESFEKYATSRRPRKNFLKDIFG